MIYLNSHQTALGEAFPRVGDKGLFSTFLDLRLRGSDVFQLLCVLSSVFICFPPEVIFRSRVIAARPVTTDCIVAMRMSEQQQQRCIVAPLWVCFPSSIAPQPRRGCANTAPYERFRKALGDMFPTPNFFAPTPSTLLQAWRYRPWRTDPARGP